MARKSILGWIDGEGDWKFFFFRGLGFNWLSVGGAWELIEDYHFFKRFCLQREPKSFTCWLFFRNLEFDFLPLTQKHQKIGSILNQKSAHFFEMSRFDFSELENSSLNCRQGGFINLHSGHSWSFFDNFINLAGIDL